MLIAIINSSTLVVDADAQAMTQACQIQNTLHTAPAWNQKPATITFYPKGKAVPGYAWLIALIDSESDVPNALGYHTVDTSDDRVIGYIMCQPVLSNNGVSLYDVTNPQNVSVASVLSHEVNEAFIDRFCSFWADGTAIKQGNEYALEVCDPVEDVSYAVSVNGLKVSMSNFVYPAFFNQNFISPQNLPLDYCKSLAAPFTMTKGGYMVVRKASGTETQIFGKDMPEWKVKIKKNEWSRNIRRKAPKKPGFFRRLFG